MSARIAAIGALAALGSAGVALAAGAHLRDWLLRSGEQPGYSVHGHPAVQRSARAYLSYSRVHGATGASFLETLRRGGFVVATEESLPGSAGREGFSAAIEFRHASGASKAVGRLVSIARAEQVGASSIREFSVPGVGGARGVIARGDSAAAVDIYWSEGRCTLGSGEGVLRTGKRSAAQIERPVIAGIEAQRSRTAAACP